MGARRSTLLLAAATIVCATGTAPAQHPPTAIGTADVSAIARATDLGRQLFDYDRAAWVSTDALTAQVPAEQLATVRGWVVEPGAVGSLTATYFSGEPGQHRALFAATVADGRVTDSRMMPDRRLLTPEQERLAAAVGIAKAEAEAKGWQSCAPAKFNTVALPPRSPDGPVSVYLLTPQVAHNKLPLGGHYRVDVAPDGKIVAERAFTKACLATPQQGGAVGVFVTHLLDPVPTEIHVSTALSAGVPVYVGTADRRMWRVDAAGVTLLPSKIGAPR